MQPYLHIFSHWAPPWSFSAAKGLRRAAFGGRRRDGQNCLEMQDRLQRSDLKPGLHIAATCADPRRSAYDRPPPPLRWDHQKGPDALPRVPSCHRPPSHRPRVLALARTRAAAVVLPALMLGSLAGCGSSHSSGTAADPAGAVPASVPLYVGATVRPAGSQKAAALASGRTLTHQADPYLRLLQLLETPGSPALSFTRDVAPWLGPQAGIFLSSLGSSTRAQSALLLSLLQQGLLGGSSTAGVFPFAAGGTAGTAGPQGAIVLDSSDAAKARSFLASQARHAGAHAAAYRGVAYQATSTGVAFGLVGRFAVIGSEPALRSVIDTTQGGPALSRASGYAKLLAVAPKGAIAHLYTKAGAARAAAGTPGAARQGEAAGLSERLVGAREANISLVPSTGSIAVDADMLPPATTGARGGLLSAGAGGAQALGELPGDSWLAFGLGHVGATLGEDVRALRALASIGSALGPAPEGTAAAPLNLKGLLDGLLTPLSVLGAESAEARRDFSSWMGSGGIFASGGSLLELKGAVVITSTNPASSRATVAKLAGQLRKAGGSVQPVSIAGTDAAVGVRLNGLPVELDIADGRASRGQTKFVLGLGEASVTSALNPSSTLSGAAPASAAATAIGEGIQPNLIVDFPTLLSLLEGVGLTEDPTLSKLVPYLRSVTTLAGGTHTIGGGIERARVVLALR